MFPDTRRLKSRLFKAKPVRAQAVRALAVLILAVAAWAAIGWRPAAAQRRADRHVVLISLDGFAAYYLDDPRVPLPNIRRLVSEGARADRMTVITPSVTWPDHTTMVTGVTPAKHGVLANGKIEPGANGLPAINPRRSKDELCRAPTVYDLAHAAGMKTAEVNWPVTRGAKSLDWSFPDHPDTLTHTTPALIRELQEQKLLAEPTDAAFRALGAVTRDEVWTGAAVHLIRRHRPNLLLLHLLNTDGTQHAHGPNTNEAHAALALADRMVGDVLQAIRDAGLRERTSVFVTADHGFIRTTQQIRPNARLRSRGLIRGDGASDRDAHSISEGGVALVYVPQARTRPELLARTREALNGLDGVERIYDPANYRELGLPLPAEDPQSPSFVLAARDGYAFGNDAAGEEVVPLPRPGGTHGYVHTNPRMDALFVAAGGGIRRGARVERVHNTQVAPTIARLLGLRMENVDGQVIDAILR